MRPLSDEETKIVFEKLAKYIGGKLKYMIDSDENPHVLRFHRERIYYASEALVKYASHYERKKLISIGTCLGKFTKSGKFRLHITSLDYLAKYAKFKIWLKPNGEQTFLYGNNVLKNHIARISEDTPLNAGVVIYNINDLPIGFGTTAKSTLQIKDSDPSAIVAFNQADVGEYLRVEGEN